LKSIQILDLMRKHNLMLQDLTAFNTIPQGSITTFFLQEWETFYEQIEKTFDTWFLNQGWSLQLPKTIYQGWNKEIRYKIPNLRKDWPSQTDLQSELPQQKDTVKYVTRNEGPNLDNDTKKVQRALQYLQESQQINQTWWTCSTNGLRMTNWSSLRDAKTCVLSASVAWTTYRVMPFTSSQEDKLAKYMENINLSSLTPMERKEFATFSENNPDTWEKCFGIAGVTYPASPNDNWPAKYNAITKTVWPSLMSISPDNLHASSYLNTYTSRGEYLCGTAYYLT
jgi:hypothetical protein